MTNIQAENLLLPNLNSLGDLTDLERENVQLVTEFLQGWISQDIEKIISVMAPDGVINDLVFPEPVKGHEGIRNFAQDLLSVVSDINYRVEDLLVRGDRVAYHGIFSGTFIGDFMGMPTTGKSFSVPYSEFVTIKNGKIVYLWDQTDGLQLVQQVGGM
ncbi:ester cyclase [Chlorogloeopsis sp. ULAP01]|uniref:ester cyclase n=1 Tax=Chlorogloeopsis sp. ULAP01 TaxID=3056483 RepID=UPI0025AAEF47|nr:ester cyclase [Chlorogloeopsis sp. ULAP01]MDM9380244.1 ester cyclase [Chlorogloeopsis sp. ULAP01]